MLSNPLSLPDRTVSPRAYHSFPPGTIQSDKLPTALPACLLQHAPQQAWSCISLSDLSNASRAGTNPIYVKDQLHKFQQPNLVFSQLRKQLTPNQLVAFRLVTAENIKQALLRKYPPLLFIPYYLVHFICRRVLPKLKGFRKICRVLNTPVDMSKAEVIGRLIYSGFDLVDLAENQQETVLVARLDPAYDATMARTQPSEGFLFQMKRIGLNGKPIYVYKLRSMHPYAEYVQAYIHRTNGLAEGGKFRNDFRVSTGGRQLRKYWLDELPMLYNWVRGDLKLVGVRPISEQYLSLYPETVRHMRRNYKPGLIPPFYADLPKSFDDIIQSEMAYLKAYETAPLQTDLRYLKRCLANIFIHKARSN